MDLKYIEELAKDKDLTNAWFCSALADFCIDDTDTQDFLEDHEHKEIREWKNLTEEEKEKLINSAIYYWTKDESNASVGKICFCVMFNQYDILHNNIDKWEFLRKLCNM